MDGRAATNGQKNLNGEEQDMKVEALGTEEVM
jgi:hypothetical protein